MGFEAHGPRACSMNGGWQVTTPQVPWADTCRVGTRALAFQAILWFSRAFPSWQMHALHRASQGRGVPSSDELPVPQAKASAKSTTARVFHVPLQEVIKAAGEERKGRTRTSERKTSTVSWPGMPAGIRSKDLSFHNDSSMKNTVKRECPHSPGPGRGHQAPRAAFLG